MDSNIATGFVFVVCFFTILMFLFITLVVIVSMIKTVVNWILDLIALMFPKSKMIKNIRFWYSFNFTKRYKYLSVFELRVINFNKVLTVEQINKINKLNQYDPKTANRTYSNKDLGRTDQA